MRALYLDIHNFEKWQGENYWSKRHPIATFDEFYQPSNWLTDEPTFLSRKISNTIQQSKNNTLIWRRPNDKHYWVMISDLIFPGWETPIALRYFLVHTELGDPIHGINDPLYVFSKILPEFIRYYKPFFQEENIMQKGFRIIDRRDGKESVEYRVPMLKDLGNNFYSFVTDKGVCVVQKSLSATIGGEALYFVVKWPENNMDTMSPPIPDEVDDTQEETTPDDMVNEEPNSESNNEIEDEGMNLYSLKISAGEILSPVEVPGSIEKKVFERQLGNLESIGKTDWFFLPNENRDDSEIESNIQSIEHQVVSQTISELTPSEVQMIDYIKSYLDYGKLPCFYLHGDHGLGKSTIAIRLSQILGVRLYFLPRITDEFVQLIGYKDANGVFHTTQFNEAWKNGGVLLIDELDRCDPMSVSVINGALASNLWIINGERLPRNPKLIIVGTGNTIGADNRYATNMLDSAFLSRFILQKITFNDDVAKGILGEYSDCLDKIKAAMIGRSLNYRHIEHLFITKRDRLNGLNETDIIKACSEIGE